MYPFSPLKSLILVRTTGTKCTGFSFLERTYMEQQITTIDEAFDVGTWVGRKQAFALVAGRCSAADAEILFEIREKKLFRTMEQTWEDFCVKRLGFSRSYADR